jgi:hypothetical protein
MRQFRSSAIMAVALPVFLKDSGSLYDVKTHFGGSEEGRLLHEVKKLLSLRNNHNLWRACSWWYMKWQGNNSVDRAVALLSFSHTAPYQFWGRKCAAGIRRVLVSSPCSAI